jgi:predicted AAA+ superfamily ATPase
VDGYIPRTVDDELDDLMQGLSAISIEGPKGVGKTETARRRARTLFALDDPAQQELFAADPQRLERSPVPVLIDEWQRYPTVWDLVRRSVDRDPAPGRFLLTGSATPVEAPTHSGAGRIVRVRMRPLSLAERLPSPDAVSLRGLLSGNSPAPDGDTGIGAVEYTEEILRSGFPAIRELPSRARRAQLDGYLARIVEHDFPEQGHLVRRPATLRAWLAAYAAATATTAAYNAILNAATAGHGEQPAKSTTAAYRDVLSQLWLLDPVPGWLPVRNQFTRLAQAPKHHLADPALAARLLGASTESLLSGEQPQPAIVRDGVLLGRLFESLIALSLRVYAQAAEAEVYHLRTQNGDHEVDFIIERDDHRIVALEVKLSASVTDADVTHLRWLSRHVGDELIDSAVIYSGRHAYRRADGIAVIPAALLGP